MLRSTAVLALLCLATGAQAVGLGNVFGALAGRSGAGGHGGSMDATLADISADFNRKTPLEVGQGTVLERVSAEPGRKLTYHYTLVAVSQGDLRPEDFQRRVAPALRQQFCGNAQMLSLLRSGVTVSYTYSSKDGAALGQASFDPDDCG
jgi:hypothetical protein